MTRDDFMAEVQACLPTVEWKYGFWADEHHAYIDRQEFGFTHKAVYWHFHCHSSSACAKNAREAFDKLRKELDDSIKLLEALDP